MICVECGHPVNDIYRQFSKGNIQLSKCNHCHHFADKYVEYDFVLIFLDLLLIRPPVYRHLLFNRLAYRESGVEWFHIAIVLAYIFFETYNKYAHDDWSILFSFPSARDVSPPGYEYLRNFSSSSLSKWFHETDWLWLLGLTAGVVVELFSMIAALLITVRIHLGNRYAIIKYNYLAMALILPCFAKPLLMLTVIWNDHIFLSLNALINMFIVGSQYVAVKVFLDPLPWWHVAGIMTCSFAVKAVVHFLAMITIQGIRD